MFSLAECAMTMNNVNINDMYYKNNTVAAGTDTMSFFGILSPAASSVDSSDIKMDQNLSPPSALCMMEDFTTDLDKPYLNIIEQPVEKFRFRYKSEMAGTHGSLIGISSDKIRKSTYPTVQLNNYEGRAFIRCSIYQMKSETPHAHRLVMKADLGEKDDPHDIEVSPERGYTATFKSMGIIHTAKKYLVPELYKKLYRLYREELDRKRVYRNFTQFEEAEIRKQAENESKTINLNTVRLKFEAFRQVDIDGTYLQALCLPIYSHGINNLKSALTGELKIVRLAHTTASCVGGQEIIILVEKVTKNNIKVRFFECDEDDNISWEDYGKFSHNDVHHQYAIVFKVPPYKDVNIIDDVNVCMELIRPSDGARSEARTFKYKPSEKIGRKRVRYNESLSSGEIPATINHLSSFGSSIDSFPEGMLACLNDPTFLQKTENLHSDEFEKAFTFSNEHLGYGALCTDGAASTPQSTPSKSSQPMTHDDLYKRIPKKVVTDLTSLLKTNPAPERLERIVENFFRDFRVDGNNALHCAIITDQIQHLRYMLLLLSRMKHLKVLDLQNKNDETALHVAVLINDSTIVKLLLSVGADPNITDKNGNTPCNIAVKNNLDLNEYIELVTATNLEKESYAGHTPLYTAVLNGKIDNVKMLIKRNADVNHKIPSSGNTILHLAIIEKNKEIVKYLLEETNSRLDIENHSKVAPMHLAKLLLTEGPESQTVYNIISEYVHIRGFEPLMIKEEPEDDTSSDDETEINVEIKMEHEPMDEPLDENSMRILKNSVFSKDCITQLGQILDGNPILEKLSKDIHFDEIQNSLLTLTTSQILNYAYVTDIKVYVVRDLLRSYGFHEAVSIIDNLYLNK